jgi:hypothetical protein
MAVSSSRSPAAIAVVVASAALAGACGEGAPPSDLAAVVAADRARLPAGAAAAFVPALDAAIVDELGGRCRTGALPAPARRCLAGARRAADVDRCVARLEGRR